MAPELETGEIHMASNDVRVIEDKDVEVDTSFGGTWHQNDKYCQTVRCDGILAGNNFGLRNGGNDSVIVTGHGDLWTGVEDQETKNVTWTRHTERDRRGLVSVYLRAGERRLVAVPSRTAGGFECFSVQGSYEDRGERGLRNGVMGPITARHHSIRLGYKGFWAARKG